MNVLRELFGSSSAGKGSVDIMGDLGRKQGESIEQWIDRLVEENPVVIFSKSYCPFCTMAKSEITRVKASLGEFKGAVVVELDTMSDGSQIQSALAKKTGRRSVPNVFINGKSIGGGDETVALARKNKLVPLVKEAVAAH